MNVNASIQMAAKFALRMGHDTGTWAALLSAMTHFNAPATKLVATHCCACHLPLVDADSVQLGIGPICRRKHGKLETTPDWSAVMEDLAKFVVAQTGDEADRADRQQFFEHAMLAAEAAKGALDDRELCNLITHYIAIAQHRHDSKLGHLCDAIEHTGRPRLAEKIRNYQYTVRITVGTDGNYRIKAPFSPDFRAAMYQYRGGRWDKFEKCWIVGPNQKGGADEALEKGYPGAKALGPKGEFMIGGAS